MQTKISMQDEMQYRLASIEQTLKFDPNQAVADAKFFAWMSDSNLLLARSYLLDTLQRSAEAAQQRQQALQSARMATGYTNEREYYKGLLNCFKHALLSGNAAEASSWANVICKSNQPVLTECYRYYLPFYRALAALWLGHPIPWSTLQAPLEKMQRYKQTYYPIGTVASLQAIEQGDCNAAATAMDQMLQWHYKKAGKVGSFIYNDFSGFICQSVTLLLICALWRGLSIKPLLQHNQQQLKLMPQDLMHRPELAPSCRFVLPVDFVPDYLLSAWQQQRLAGAR
ncbi:hypothetical protein A5320_01805 [Rheinheimera sp. SA_1]|uniref:hypothetical protein n=1 Tax=Rheinheimera sp. SA_1 TaxID=1827365 RepID=UPI0007FEF745|nr:hypothetical protein [Rheinheimera sp. SA_1]OBP16178.1 hypothetical protein A5320_01805 [Rheinheimera sp. SA_1]